MKIRTTATGITLAAIVAITAYAGWEIGSVSVKTRAVPAPAGYTTVSVEAVSGTETGRVTVCYVTMMPVTNTLATLELTDGHAVSNAIAATFRQGDFIFATGNPLTNGSAQVSIRR